MGCVHATVAEGDSIVEIDRPGQAPLRYLATVPEGKPPSAGALLFVGGDGVLDLAGKGIPHPGNSFLLHARRVFAEHGLAVAAFDPGTGPLSDQDRMSAAHAEEARRVLRDFRQRYKLDRITLIGTSRGTISAAWLALRFRGEIDGVVLASTVFASSRTGPGLEGFDFGQ
ncbi:MAG: alpha/beta fold hydrolase, partial [Noviherbaspirillum sp.]